MEDPSSEPQPDGPIRKTSSPTHRSVARHTSSSRNTKMSQSESGVALEFARDPMSQMARVAGSREISSMAARIASGHASNSRAHRTTAEESWCIFFG